MILLRPWWLLALPVLAGIALAIRRRGPDAGGWQAVMPPHMLAGLAALGQLGTGAGWPRMLPLAAAAALALGLAGPAVPRPDSPVLAQADAVVIAIDMSPSVAQGPALADAQAAAAGLLARLAGRPVGLILFAGEAYAVAAPTGDPATLQTQIAVLDAETMPDQGSRPAAALALAGQMLRGTARADLVLISDGGGIDGAARAEAGRLAAAGIGISALTVRGNPPGRVQDLAGIASGPVVPADQPAALAQALAASGLARDPALRALRYRDLGPWSALLALALLLPRFRRQA
ncbi:Ca-activated chloride channel family protein [Paracoccus thiocyanatus]|uniref:Ca-activated chloride channel family protein n=1 Tax=Paracoccus thiocyanatus TaxID=34006 RepID=A0A1N6WJ68_9RHOB|nr:vWA domain-containing protein [Paracoccus thiocyanatus]SIQ90062.1 Ca-activated chloride channel family protein [Paracoccus thiocyanatus]